MRLPRLVFPLVLLAACAGGRGVTAVTPTLAVRNLERGAYREARFGPQRIELVLPDGGLDVLDAPTTRGGAEVRGDCIAAARRGRVRVAEVAGVR